MSSGLQFPSRDSGPATWLWIGLIGAASILLSRAFACATPFAALLHYPWTPSTFGWGAAIGIAACASLLAAREVARRVGTPLWGLIPLALTAAFATYELVLYVSTSFLPAGQGAFAFLVLLRIFAINVAAIGLLLAAHYAARLAAYRLRRSAPATS